MIISTVLKAVLLAISAAAPLCGAHVLPRNTPGVPEAPFVNPDESLKVPGRFLVTLKAGHSVDQHFAAIGVDFRKMNGTDFKYIDSINTYMVTTDDNTIHQKVRHDLGVEVVEVSHNIKMDYEPDERIYDPPNPGNASLSVSKRWDNLTMNDMGFWYSAQISAGRKIPEKMAVDPAYQYVTTNNPLPGTGVNIYILDTGVELKHNSLKVRTFQPGQAVTWFTGGPRTRNFRSFATDDARDLKDDERSPYATENMADTIGHGTHVAGVAASWEGGAAINASVVNVKVLGKGATTEHIARAIVDVTNEHIAFKKKPPPGWKGSVINMSFWVTHNRIIEEACKYAYMNGVALVAAAGNENKAIRPEDGHAPCRYPTVLCVGATDIEYNKASFSNIGTAINVMAPGKDMIGSLLGGGFSIKSGTSMAAPIVSGIIANFLGFEGAVLYDDTAKIYDRLLANALNGVIGNLAVAPNMFATLGLHHPDRVDPNPYSIKTGFWVPLPANAGAGAGSSGSGDDKKPPTGGCNSPAAGGDGTGGQGGGSGGGSSSSATGGHTSATSGSGSSGGGGTGAAGGNSASSTSNGTSPTSTNDKGNGSGHTTTGGASSTMPTAAGGPKSTNNDSEKPQTGGSGHAPSITSSSTEGKAMSSPTTGGNGSNGGAEAGGSNISTKTITTISPMGSGTGTLVVVTTTVTGNPSSSTPGTASGDGGSNIVMTKTITTISPIGSGTGKQVTVTTTISGPAASQTAADDALPTGPLCHLNITELKTCADLYTNLYAQVSVTDRSGKSVYVSPADEHLIIDSRTGDFPTGTNAPKNVVGVSINDRQPLNLTGVIWPNWRLVVIGEHVNDYIQFYHNIPGFNDGDAWVAGNDFAGGRTNTGARCVANREGFYWPGGQPKCDEQIHTRKFNCVFNCGR